MASPIRRSINWPRKSFAFDSRPITLTPKPSHAIWRLTDSARCLARSTRRLSNRARLSSVRMYRPRSRSQWSHAFEALTRMAALGDAIETAKGSLDGRAGMEAIERMKAERDALRRAIGSGTIWEAGLDG